MSAIRVMIADDHSLIREGLRQLLEFDGSIKVVGEAANGVECLENLEKYDPEVLLLDINMPEMNGIEVLKKMKESQSAVKVLILTVHNELEYLMNAVDIGVEGYIMKDSESAELKKAIRAVRDGENYIQTNLELEVLVQVANGMFNKEIATNLNISERTVKNHISNIFKKIEVSDRTQAAVFAIKNNIIKLY